jgi:hypothetical protein
VAVQARYCFVNLADALTHTGGKLTHLAYVRYDLLDSGDWGRVTPEFGEVLAGNRPAASCMICGL